jgi:hypothetical protein
MPTQSHFIMPDSPHLKATSLLLEARVTFLSSEEIQRGESLRYFLPSDIHDVISQSLQYHVDHIGSDILPIMQVGSEPILLPRAAQQHPDVHRYSISVIPSNHPDQFDRELFEELRLRFVLQAFHLFKPADLPTWDGTIKQRLKQGINAQDTPSGHPYAPRIQFSIPTVNRLPEKVFSILIGLPPSFYGTGVRNFLAITNQLFTLAFPSRAIHPSSTTALTEWYPRTIYDFREHIGIRLAHWKPNPTKKDSTPVYYIAATSEQVYTIFINKFPEKASIFGVPVEIRPFPKSSLPGYQAARTSLTTDLRKISISVSRLIKVTMTNLLIPSETSDWPATFKQIPDLVTYAPLFSLSNPHPVAFSLAFSPNNIQAAQHSSRGELFKMVPSHLLKQSHNPSSENLPSQQAKFHPNSTASIPNTRILSFWDTPALTKSDTSHNSPSNLSSPLSNPLPPSSTSPPPDTTNTPSFIDLTDITPPPPPSTPSSTLPFSFTPPLSPKHRTQPNVSPSPPSKRARMRASITRHRTSLQEAAALAAKISSEPSDDPKLNTNRFYSLSINDNPSSSSSSIQTTQKNPNHPTPPASITTPSHHAAPDASFTGDDDDSHTTLGQNDQNDPNVHSDVPDSQDTFIPESQDLFNSDADNVIMDDTISDTEDSPYHPPNPDDSQTSCLSNISGFVSEDSTAPAPLPLPGALRLLETFPIEDQEILSRLYSRVPPHFRETFVATASTRPGFSVLLSLVVAWEQQSEPAATCRF